ncbi:hypothetical protein D3C87_1532120 [compost metagenome]
MIASGAAYAAARLAVADVHLQRPGLIRQATQQASPIFLLLFFAVFGGGLAALVTGADTVLLIIGIHRRQIAVVTQHLLQCTQLRRGRNMGYLTAHRINRQRFTLHQFG